MVSADAKKTIWKLEALPRATRVALETLAGQSWLKRSAWYLAGGTTLALQVGHRQSFDLDFFTRQDNFSNAALLKHLTGQDWKTDILKEGTVYGEFMGVKVSFIAYPFFYAQERPLRFGSIRVVPPRDIAVMKIIAISQRGRKRDFVDLYWYLKNRGPLLDLFRLLPEQYPTVKHNYHHILKSLMYFADAEEDPMPELFFKAQWSSIKNYFLNEVPRVARKWLGFNA